MISFSGKVWGPRRGSYLYAIVEAGCIYFGETGSIPPDRWGQHVRVGGTFTGKLFGMDKPVESGSDQDMVFIGVRCLVVENEVLTYRKNARRAIEEELHRQFNLDSGAFRDDLVLISAPPPPAVRYKWSFNPRDVAREIYAVLVNEYRRWRFEGKSEK